MVIPDGSRPERPPKIEVSLDTSEHMQLARPIDRLAAAIIDIFVVLTPLFVLLSAPLKKGMMMSFILGAEPDFFLAIVFMTLLAGIVLIVYQTLSYHFMGTTIGKRALGLKLISVFSDQSTLGIWNLFLRSFVWVFGILCFGLPWLSVFSNVKRRALHDRVCDTIVVSTRGGAESPMLWERAMVRSVFSVLVALFSLSLLVQIQMVVSKMRMERSLASFMENQGAECEVVSHNFSEELDLDHARLKKAMTLYAAGMADKSCLEAEVEREIAQQIPVAPITYLAQAFVYADEADISNSYLDEVCEVAPSSPECAMSRLVSNWSDEDWDGVEQILNTSPFGSGYLEVWGVRHYMKQAQYDKALVMLDQLAGYRELADFSLVQRVKGLFNVYKEGEAIAALQQAQLILPEEEGRDLSAWVCAQQLQKGCGALNGSACQQAKPANNVLDINFELPAQSLMSVLAMECKNPRDVDYLTFSEVSADSDWRTFFLANLKRQREDRGASAELFARVVGSSSAPDILRIEATRRWIRFANPQQMNRMVDLWHQFDNREVWVKAGNLLLSRLAEQKNFEQALNVARNLLTWQSLSPQASAVLGGLNLESGKQTPVRKPASPKPGGP